MKTLLISLTGILLSIAVIQQNRPKQTVSIAVADSLRSAGCLMPVGNEEYQTICLDFCGGCIIVIDPNH